MHQVSIREARAHLAEILDHVGQGQVISITRRGREVARIVPASQASPVLPSRITTRAAMIAQGAIVSDSTVVTLREEERW